jgi:hypothetical protein
MTGIDAAIPSANNRSFVGADPELGAGLAADVTCGEAVTVTVALGEA